MLLVLVSAVTDFAQTMDEDRAGQAIAGLALVKFLTGFAARLGVADPVQHEQRALQPTQLAQRGGNAILARIGEASWRMISDAVTVPVRMDAATRRMSAQWARISATLMRPAISGSSVGVADGLPKL